MLKEILAAVILTALGVRGQGVCKDPHVEQRLLADDVRYASPFYVIALPKNPRTEQMDNVCYTYYETPEGGFFHIMSITNKNGSNEFFTYKKEDITDRMGLAEAKAEREPECVYHDYTLTPICKMSVFILYRCFIRGNCGGIDIGPTFGVDVRVTLAANPIVSAECRQELEQSLKDTSKLAGADYVILPQKLAPQCVTRYNNTDSIGHKRAVGSKLVSENELIERFGIADRSGDSGPTPPVAPRPQSAANQGRPAMAPTNSNVNRPVNQYGNPSATGSQGYIPLNNGQWNAGPSPWGPQTNGEQHFHMWQQQPNGQKTTVPPRKNSNVFYHVHTWENPPPGCCKCNN